jgi:hypothetical protein
MASIFSLTGCYQVQPASGSPSGDPIIDAPLDEQLVLKAVQVLTVTLDTDAPEALAFGDLAAAHVLVIRATGGKVRLRATSTDGAAQAIPFDPLIILMSSAVPITAADLTRVAGSGTVTCKVLLGEKA